MIRSETVKRFLLGARLASLAPERPSSPCVETREGANMRAWDRAQEGR